MWVMAAGTVPILALLSHCLCSVTTQMLNMYSVCVCVCSPALDALLLPLRILSSRNFVVGEIIGS